MTDDWARWCCPSSVAALSSSCSSWSSCVCHSDELSLSDDALELSCCCYYCCTRTLLALVASSSYDPAFRCCTFSLDGSIDWCSCCAYVVFEASLASLNHNCWYYWHSRCCCYFRCCWLWVDLETKNWAYFNGFLINLKFLLTAFKWSLQTATVAMTS